ncbi:hypothetical protein [Aquimarina macrocephali]|uniref:hypothetical protein n=1 Tax=Aquimarina macrocephali TaxID=666563 RepID=UPI003F673B6F
MQKTISDKSQLEKRDIIKNENLKVETNTGITRKSNKITYTPIDNDEPIVVDGVEYTNTIVEKEFKEEVDTTKIIHKKDSKIIDQTIVKTKEQKSEKNVNLERDNSFDFFDWLWLFLALGLILLIYKKRKTIFMIN